MNDNMWEQRGEQWFADGTATAYYGGSAESLPSTYICLWQDRLYKMVVPKGEVLYQCPPTEEAVALLHEVFHFLNTLSVDAINMIDIDHVVALVESSDKLEQEQLNSLTMVEAIELYNQAVAEAEQDLNPVEQMLLS